MKEKFVELINEIKEKFLNQINDEEIEKLLELEKYNTEEPKTKKRLIINKIKFSGVKNNQQKIDFEKEFYGGLNIIVADNLKGKSSIFKILKFALTGNDDLKKDIKEWINEIFIGFQINKTYYTIRLDTSSKRISGGLYKINIKDFSQPCEDRAIFYEKTLGKYSEKIEEFFFKQFSYYSLKWTQKNSQKDKSELVESGTSWKTYFKSIYLESKHSTIDFGGQDKKTFQMLLNLNLTKIINELTIKKDKLEEIKGTIKLDNSVEDKKELSDILIELEKIKNDSSLKKLLELEDEQKKVLNIMDKNIKNREEYNSKFSEKLEFERELIELSDIKKRMRKEILRIKKRIENLIEYLEVGYFFSNLDIKHCPSCNHEVTYDLEIISETEKCPLCSKKINSKINNEKNFEEKIEELKIKEVALNTEEIKIKEKYSELSEKVNILRNEINLKEKNIIKIDELEEQSQKIREKINTIKIERQNLESKEKELISQKAVLEYKIKEESDLKKYEEIKLNINILDFSIDKLIEKRYDINKKILEKLSNLILIHIHEFGLNSISKVEINKNLDIKYLQNDYWNKFDEIAEGEQLRVKLAFYLGLMRLNVNKHFAKHTQFLIIDSPGKEEGDTQYLSGLKDVLTTIDRKYGKRLQIIIGTAERQLEGITENELKIKKGDFVF